jgi:ABC-type spermidine/putrescine transport system permease subunit I
MTVAPVAGRSRSHRVESLWLIVPLVVFEFAFFGIPLVIVLYHSVVDGGFTLRHYGEIFTTAIYYKVLLQTLKIAFLVTAISLVLGYPVAYVIVRSGRFVRGVLLLAVLVPLWTSLLARTYAFQVLLGRDGVVNSTLLKLGIVSEPLKMMYTTTPVVLGMVQALLPFMVLTCYAVMRTIDRDLVTAAQSMGARPARAFRTVYLPLSMPGVLTGVVLVFILSMGFFVTPVILGGLKEYTIAGLITLQMQQVMNWGLGSALAITLLAAVGLLVYVYQRRFSIDRLLGAE